MDANIEEPKKKSSLDSFDHLVSQSAGLRAVIPSVYFIWTEAVLSSDETGQIQKMMTGFDWIQENDKQVIKSWTDAKQPPSAQQLKIWRAWLKNHLKPDQTHSMSSFGEQLYHLSPEVNANPLVKTDLQQLEEALGLIGTEFYQRLSLGSQPGQQSTRPVSSSFDIKAMTSLLDGKDAEVIVKVKSLIATEEFAYASTELNKDDYRDKVLEWCQKLADEGFGAIAYPVEYGGKDDIAEYFAVMEALSFHDLSLVIKYGVQFGLFGMSVMFLGTKKHHDKYLKDIGELKLAGCFAMTETGHGSNVRDLETTAIYDESTDEFIIHTPHEQAGKEYIGNAARHGRMATVFAQLIVNNTNYGVSALLVPIRDENGQPMPGVRIEDNGHKIGLNGVDNGKLWFDHVRIPRENLLDRFAQVSEDGQYTSPINSDSRRFFTMLGTLVGGRIAIPRAGLSAAKSGLTIAIRHAEKRKQFGAPGAPEQPIMDYKTHQRRLMPLLAKAYAIQFTLQYVTERFRHRSSMDEREIEALAAGMKAYSTWNTTETLQTCREACGGKGYLSENRIGTLKADTDVFTTFEGDNTVLMQLVAKTRLTEFKQEFQDVNFFTIVRYIGNQAKTKITEQNPIITRKTDSEHLRDPEFHLNAFRFRERSILNSAARRLKHYLDQGMNSFDAFNECQYHLVQVAFAYVERLTLEQFVAKVASTEDTTLQSALKRLCDLYALSQIEKHKGWYLEQDYMVGAKSKAIRKEVNALCAEVREEALALTEAFAIPEQCLSAPIAL